MRPVPQAVGTPYGVPGEHWAAGRHTGIDFLCPTGTPVKAAVGGTVVFAGTQGGWGAAYGRHVVVQSRVDGVTYQALYAHLSAVSVRDGQNVEAGDVVGRSGATGNVTGPHLHFELRRSPYRYGNDVDPGRAVNYAAAPQPNNVAQGRDRLADVIADLAEVHRTLKRGQAKTRPRIVAARAAIRTARRALKAVHRTIPAR